MKYILPLALFFAACTNIAPTTKPCPCPCDSTVVVQPPKDTGFILGVNCNHWHPKEQQIRLQSVRLYMPIGWAWTEKGFYGYPLKQAQKQFLGIDDYLIYMESKKVDVLLTLMQSPDYLNGHTQGIGTNDYPPIRPGADKTDSKSYAEIGSVYKAFAIRYGSKTWPSGSYKIDPALPRWNGDERQVEKSGLGLVEWIEVGNEVDRWWNPDQALTAEQHAAFLMTCYDSIKSADPKMNVSMAGLTNYDLPYLKKMQAWFTAHGRKFCSDCINVHHYASTGNLPGVHPPTWPVNSGAPFDQDKDFATVSQVIAWAKTIGLPVWVSEYGYATKPGSQLYPYALNGKTAEQLQADWIESATLEYKRLGVARCYVFSMADEPNPNGGTFNSSGLLYGESTGYKEKPAMGKVALMCETFKGK